MDCSCRLLYPWTSADDNTGVGSHSLFPENLPHPGIEPRSPALLADSLPFEPLGKPGKAVPVIIYKDDFFLKQKCIHKHTHTHTHTHTGWGIMSTREMSLTKLPMQNLPEINPSNPLFLPNTYICLVQSSFLICPLQLAS